MGNKSAKFTVNNEKNPEENGTTEPEVKADVEAVAANGDHPKTETVETTEETVQTKKKNPLAWLKKVSIRKEKKPKTAKDTNGVNHENGDVKEEKTEETTPVENGVTDEPKADETEPVKAETTEEVVEEATIEQPTKTDETVPEIQMNGHCEVENTCVAVEVQ